MTPEEKFNQDVWWILREIRNDELLTPKGEMVEFCIRVQSKTPSRAKQTNTLDFPAEDNQRKLLNKLKEWQAIDLESVNDILKGSDIFNPRIYQLAIKRPKFDELYNLYEKSFRAKEEREVTPPKSNKNIFNWATLSQDNLQIAQKVIRVTLNFLQLQPMDRFTLGTRIPLQKFENEQVFFDDVVSVLDRINGVKVRNEELLYKLKEHQRNRIKFPGGGFGDDLLSSYFTSEEELEKYLFLQISSIDGLQRVRNLVDSELKIRKDDTLPEETERVPSMYLVSVKDREIWING